MGTGFKFYYGLDESIKEMIEKWSKQNLVKDLEFVRSGKMNMLMKEEKLVILN